MLDSLLTILNASQATREILYGLIILCLAAIYARASSSAESAMRCAANHFPQRRTAVRR